MVLCEVIRTKYVIQAQNNKMYRNMKHKSGNKVGYGASKAPADAYADNGQKDGKIEQETVLFRVDQNNQQKDV